MQQVSVLETNIGSSTTGNSANQQIIFNDSGVLRGDTDLTFNTALNLLTVTNLAVSAAATITGNLTVDTNTLFVDAANNRVGVGTATPARPLDIVGSFQSSLGWVLTGTPAGLGAATRYIGGASTTDSWYYNAVTGGSHLWAFGESLAMTLNSTGLGVGVVPSAGKGALQLSSGINFPATQVASTDANTLDDYEEGTFTPTIVGITSAGTGTYTTQLGRYTKVGRIVTCDISLVWTAHTGTGNMDIDGLPFSVLSTTGYAASAVIGYIDNIALTAGNIPIAVLWWFNTTKIRLNQTPTGGGAAAGVPMDTAGQINLSITYIVA